MGISTPFLALVVSIAYIIVSKLIVGKNKKKISETAGENIQIWGLLIIGIIGICSVFFFLDIFNNNVMKWFWLFFLILTLGFQSFLEWKFLKDSKEYVVSLIVLMLGLIYILIFIF
ncbi:protein of unknown function [Gracilibacillus orientalis]|uniref:DUF4181 domain-containing protein n=1 Tax=Gracilibacillus orientalis TaxID=334253 RepID=A0A1I4M6D2_9BACI|nr:DUF4181 domain-containing protein [Gracilibacillus orientalis]SFL98784.1 protein of unknown function [Gracilibacillus orientalis]